MLNWRELVKLSDAELARIDVAEVNLACAADFRDAPSERVVRECLARLDHYAKCTADYTEKRMPEYHAQREVYDNSPGLFRIICMISMLQKVYGVRYNLAKRDPHTPFDTADTFIHGALVGNGGTCPSLPVIYVAVGRRLGYPLKLVEAKKHCFCRWEEPKGERFNIEVNDSGINTFPDDYYRQWPYAVSPMEEQEACFLQSHTPRMALADFLRQRAWRWFERKAYRNAAESHLWSAALVPENKYAAFYAKLVLETWRRHLAGRVPRGFPQLDMLMPSRFFPESIPLIVERHFLQMEGLERCLDHPIMDVDVWIPLRRRQPVRMPRYITGHRDKGLWQFSFR